MFHVTDHGGLEAATADRGYTYWSELPSRNECTRVESGTELEVGTGAAITASLLVNCGTGGAAFTAVSYGPGWYLPSVGKMLLLAQSNVIAILYFDQ